MAIGTAVWNLKPTAPRPVSRFALTMPETEQLSNVIGVAVALTPDGQRFLMVQASEQEEAATQINVVLNWFEELKRRVPTGN